MSYSRICQGMSLLDPECFDMAVNSLETGNLSPARWGRLSLHANASNYPTGELVPTAWIAAGQSISRLVFRCARGIHGYLPSVQIFLHCKCCTARQQRSNHFAANTMKRDGKICVILIKKVYTTLSTGEVEDL